MNVWKLRLSMGGTLAILIGLSTLFLTVVLSLVGLFDILTLGILVAVINVVQWLISPYLIDALYRAHELSAKEAPKLNQMVDELSKKSSIGRPRLMLAQIPLPNAFAYGSPLAKSRIAVTDGLLKALNEGEVEAVVGHELGHLKHRDMHIMMFVSLLPAVAYYIGYSLMMSSTFGRQREEGASGALIGVVFMAFSWILNLFILHLSRIREYYADQHSASIVVSGPSKLSSGLAKIVNATKSMSRARKQTQNLTAFKALFIVDPDRSETDYSEMVKASREDQRLVQEILSRKLSTADKILEILSTHPNIVKRLNALKRLEQAPS